MDNESRDLLNNLIETLKDGEYGFKTAAEDVSNPDLKRIFNEYSAQRAGFAQTLQSKVERSGEEAEDSGSVAGTLHRGWMNAKSAVTTRDDVAILEECERGEDSAVSAFRDALAEPMLVERPTLEQQYGQIKAAHDHVRTLRDSLKQVR